MDQKKYKKKYITLHKIKVFAPNGVDISVLSGIKKYKR